MALTGEIVLQEVVRDADAEIQQESSAVFREILEQGLVSLPSYTQTFLQTILMCVNNKDPGTTLTPVLTACSVPFCMVLLSPVLVGGMAQWLGRWSVAGGLSLTYA